MASGTLLQCPQSGQTVTHVPGLNCQPCPRTVPVRCPTTRSSGPPANGAGGYPRGFAARRPLNVDVRPHEWPVRFFTVFFLALALPLCGSSIAGESQSYLDRLRGFESRLVYAGPAPQRFENMKPPAGVREVLYQSGTLWLKAWLALPALSYSRPLPGVVYFHGGFALGASDLDDARPFLDAGFAVMTPMLRAENGNPGSFELLLGEVDDAAAAVRWLASHRDVNSERIYAFGHSVGGGVAALLTLRPGLPLRHTGSVGGLYTASVFDDWRDIIPFDPQRAGERELRLLLGNLRWMRCPHFAFLGGSDRLLQSREIALRELGATKAQLSIEVVPGDHFSSLPAAAKAYLRIIERSSP